VITPGLIILVVVVLWCGLAHLVGWSFYKWTGRRWVQVLAVVVVAALPLWDLPAGLTAYGEIVRERGSNRVYRKVSAEGYLAQEAWCQTCWVTLLHNPYQFIEVKRTGQPHPLRQLEQGSGYYEYRIAPIDDPRCEPFKALPHSDQLRQLHELGERCVVVTRRDAPISRYAMELSQGWQPAANGSRAPQVQISCQRYVDLQADELLAEACRARYVSWLARWLTVPEWVHDRDEHDKPIGLDVVDVIKPSSRATEQ
jgi:hypothetical protein